MSRLRSQQERSFQPAFRCGSASLRLSQRNLPGYLAPILRNSHEFGGLVECVPTCFGMLPHWADAKLVRQTYNARSETVANKPSFPNAWRRRQFCIIPAKKIFEPSYASGRALRWRIEQEDGSPLGIVGIWEWRAEGPDGSPLISFSMLTINADAHPLMSIFHISGDTESESCANIVKN